ncbi:MAG: peptide/nickel transport system permease protein [Micromonosporaceae bacterium]|jgi:peptide/nickel transport system permease protein|nr:peptide/nickel transport system permease protein [Micromonosporaceae bacterium]
MAVASAPTEVAAPSLVVRAPSFARRHGFIYVCALVWICLVVGVAIFADLLPLRSPTAPDYSHVRSVPSMQHWLGTDSLGRDTLSRVIYGARVSLTVSALALLLGLTIGLTLGLIAGYFRGVVETVILTVADSMLAFPAIVFLMVLTGVLGQSLPNVVVGLGVIYVPTFVRLARANTLVFAQREFVLAARAGGARGGRIIRRDILPNVAVPVFAYSFVIVAHLIVAEGTLSFLGLGIPPPRPSWGAMIAEGRQDLADYPHVVLIPAAVLFLTVLCMNIVGDRFRERLDAREAAV